MLKYMNKKYENIKQLLQYISQISKCLLNKENNLESQMVNYKIILEELKENNSKKDENYNKILENCSEIPNKIQECIKIEKEKSNNYNNIKKMEDFLEKYKITPENENSEDYSKTSNIEKINSELDKIKTLSTKVSDIVINQTIEFINSCKEEIASYIETQDNINDFIENEYVSIILNKENNNSENIIINGNNINTNEEIANTPTNMLENVNIDKKIKDIKNKIVATGELGIKEKVKNECEENINCVQKLLDNINDLSLSQENHKKVAFELGINYIPLNNVSEMKKNAEILNEQLYQIDTKVRVLCMRTFNEKIKSDLEIISKTNIGITSLFKYLNEPKSFVGKSTKTRFEEIMDVEERELKRKIAEKAREIRSAAELRKLKDDLRTIEKKGILNKFIGTFTGRNKIDSFIKSQIEYRKMAINSTLSKKIGLTQNCNIDELMAEITMFINDNRNDELVKNDVSYFKSLAKELRKNYDILENKVQSIIEKREGNNLLFDKRKASKKEIMELETHKFLNKYGYNLYNIYDEEDYEYKDTMPSEIDRIIEYINCSNVI